MIVDLDLEEMIVRVAATVVAVAVTIDAMTVAEPAATVARVANQTVGRPLQATLCR
jgi:hypothetical protein